MSQKLELYKGPRCEIDNCKCTVYYKADGKEYCKEGHEQPGGLSQETSFGDNTPSGQVSRIQKEKVEVGSRVVRGINAKELFLQAYQFILTKQCYELIHLIGFPEELEDTVRYLWSLRLQLLSDSPDFRPDEEKTYSSQPTNDEEEKAKKDRFMPTMMGTLGICYLAMLLLRLPVSIGDLHRWAIREDIPFIRAIRFVPNNLKQSLPAEYHRALDTNSALEPDDVRNATLRLCLFYERHLELSIPPLNINLLLHKYMRSLSLPINIFLAVRRMVSIFPRCLTFKFEILEGYQQVIFHPEVSLVCLLVIAVKIYHPFSDNTLHTPSLSDISALKINWSKWTEARKEHRERMSFGDHLQPGTEMKVNDDDVMNMTDIQLDDYLDWYRELWVDEERALTKRKGLSRQLLRMFPTDLPRETPPRPYDYKEQTEKEHQSKEEFQREVISSMESRPVKSQDEDTTSSAQMTGSQYRQYGKPSDLTGSARAFHEEVAEIAAIHLETLLRAVTQMEFHLQIWREEQIIEKKERRKEQREQKNAAVGKTNDSSELSDSEDDDMDTDTDTNISENEYDDEDEQMADILPI